jgi:hypothetical protein
MVVLVELRHIMGKEVHHRRYILSTAGSTEEIEMASR